MRHVESRIQQMFIRWFRMQYPQYARVGFAVGNGGARSRAEAAIMKGEGVMAGVADMLITVPRGGYGCLGLEFKTDKGRQSAEQKEWQRAFESAGNRYAVVRSIEEAISVTNDYLRQ